jgi:hypothetical protein
VRVVPREDAGTWVIREPTSEIFEPASVRLQTLPQPNKFQDQFKIFFCDNLNELMKHYFHDFQVETTLTVRKPSQLPGTVRRLSILILNSFNLRIFEYQQDLSQSSVFVLVKSMRFRKLVR